MTGLFNNRNRSGADIERELRKQQRERARRGGLSTAALEARVWFEVVQHLPDHSASRIVADCGEILTDITGITATSKLRAIVTAARETRGMRLHLGGWGGAGDEADRAHAQAAQEAQAEDARHRAEMAAQGREGGPESPSRLEAGLRDTTAADAARAGRGTAAHRLKRANAALSEAGLEPISGRTLRRILKKVGHPET